MNTSALAAPRITSATATASFVAGSAQRRGSSSPERPIALATMDRPAAGNGDSSNAPRGGTLPAGITTEQPSARSLRMTATPPGSQADGSDAGWDGSEAEAEADYEPRTRSALSGWLSVVASALTGGVTGAAIVSGIRHEPGFGAEVGVEGTCAGCVGFIAGTAIHYAIKATPDGRAIQAGADKLAPFAAAVGGAMAGGGTRLVSVEGWTPRGAGLFGGGIALMSAAAVLRETSYRHPSGRSQEEAEEITTSLSNTQAPASPV